MAATLFLRFTLSAPRSRARRGSFAEGEETRVALSRRQTSLKRLVMGLKSKYDRSCRLRIYRAEDATMASARGIERRCCFRATSDSLWIAVDSARKSPRRQVRLENKKVKRMVYIFTWNIYCGSVSPFRGKWHFPVPHRALVGRGRETLFFLLPTNISVLLTDVGEDKYLSKLLQNVQKYWFF